jgi:hypothetical protein
MEIAEIEAMAKVKNAVAVAMPRWSAMIPQATTGTPSPM